MGKLVAYIIILIFLIFSFLVANNLFENSYAVEDVKYSISLSAKALANSIEVDKQNNKDIALGFDNSIDEVVVDKEKLLKEFYDVLYMNYHNEEVFEKIKRNLLAKLVVYKDKCYVAGVDDKWSPPYFFTKDVGGNLVYLNSENDLAYHYNLSGDKVYGDISIYGITKEEKQQIIIDKINGLVSQYTYDYNKENGLKIETYNPFKTDGKYIRKYSRFNVLDGLTFFVVYAENTNTFIDNKEFKFKNYNVVGYTMEFY